MRITDLPAYQRINSKFEDGTFTHGVKNTLPIYSWDGPSKNTSEGFYGPYHEEKNAVSLTPGHYVHALSYSRINFADVPYHYRTRDFFLHALSGCYDDIIAYVKKHLGTKFDRDFFKDHIATEDYALEFENNCFAYMPLEYIDEEMISEAMYQAVNRRYVERRNDFDDWFYSVAKRKPDVLTQDFWTLAARCFASRTYDGKNKILEMTPEKYRTKEYYFAMCLDCDTPVMEDFPEEILTNDFLVSIINDNVENIKCFSADALEKTVRIEGHEDTYKYWQAAILLNGYVIRYIPLNDERIEFFLKHYDKDTGEYRYGFKDKYHRYKMMKAQENRPDKNNSMEHAHLALALAIATGSVEDAVDVTTSVAKDSIDRRSRLPIKYAGQVPEKYCKKYDSEEYLSEIYSKLGIKIEGECSDGFYYSVLLPEDISIESSDYGYHVMDSNDNKVLTYYDRGNFYDRDVKVDKIFISL